MPRHEKLLCVLVVNPWHWLDENGQFPSDHPRLWPKLIRIGQYVQMGCDLKPKHGRETLIYCKARGCKGWMWVARTPDDALLTFCGTCHKQEMLITHWEDTLWSLHRASSIQVLQ